MCTAGPINVYQGTFDLKSIVNESGVKDGYASVNICDLSDIVSKYNTWIRLMPNVVPYYALKCNNEIPVLNILQNLGTGVDCASKTEIELALSVGFKPEKIIFANTAKEISHIQCAKANNVTDGTVDNEFEIYKLFKYYPESNIVLRFRSDAKKAIRPFGKKFGCDAEENGGTLLLLAKSLDMNVKGVSFHVGSGCEDVLAYERAISIASRLFRTGKLMKHTMDLLDIGGGFPGDDDEFFGKIAKVVNKSLNQYMHDFKLRVIAEPGRYLVSKAFTTLCKIYSKREVRGEDGELVKAMYYVNDGIYATFNKIVHESETIVGAIHFEDENNETFSSLIWGPTCDAHDMVCDNINLPSLKDGDIIAFPNMGAYSVTRSCSFNGFILPVTHFYIRKDLEYLLDKK